MVLLKLIELCLTQVRHERGERLIEPEVIPPFHGDEVAKPHMTELVQVCVAESGSFLESLLLTSEEICLVVGNTANVFHGSCIELCAEHLVILVEWVRTAKKIGVKLDTSLGCKEHLLMIDIVHTRLSCIDSHRWHTLNVALEVAVGTGNNNVEVGRDAG